MIRKEGEPILSKTALSILLMLSMVFFSLSDAFSIEREYVVKAVFLERFTRFVEWPEEADIDNPSLPFIICVIGKNPFDEILEQVYGERVILGKPVEIRYISSLKAIEPCHLLFVSASMRAQLDKILSYTENKPILTVGDTEGFSERGLHINLYLQEESVRFAINETAVRNSPLKMDFRLLQSAKIINPVETKE